MKLKKKQTCQPLITKTGRVMKNIALKREEAWLKPEILNKTIYLHLHKRKLLSPSSGVIF